MADIISNIEIPETWIKCELREVLSLKNGFAFQSSNYISEGIPVVRISDINDGYVMTGKSVKVMQKEECEDYIVEKGDILIAMSGATTGKFGIYTSNEKAYQNQRVGNFKIHIPDLLNKLYVYYLLFALRDNILQSAYGGAQPNISSGKIEEFKIPLAPLNEQNRIVDKLDELLSELEKGKEHLLTSLEQLKVYRQSILKHAFEGKLTSNESDLKKVNFHSIIKLVSGNTPKGIEKATNSGTIPFYRVSDMNLDGNEVVMRTSNVSLSVAEQEKLKIKTFPKGTVIFPKRGGAILTNKKRILGEVASFDLNLMGALPNEKVSSKYLYYWFVFLDLSKICDGSNVPQINYKNFDSIVFDFFEPDIQIKIVDLVESHLSTCDDMESSILKNIADSDSLRSVILQKAFEGKLIEQDPTDEPANVLLDRIKKEREGYLKAEKERKNIKIKGAI